MIQGRRLDAASKTLSAPASLLEAAWNQVHARSELRRQPAAALCCAALPSRASSTAADARRRAGWPASRRDDAPARPPRARDRHREPPPGDGALRASEAAARACRHESVRHIPKQDSVCLFAVYMYRAGGVAAALSQPAFCFAPRPRYITSRVLATCGCSGASLRQARVPRTGACRAGTREPPTEARRMPLATPTPPWSRRLPKGRCRLAQTSLRWWRRPATAGHRRTSLSTPARHKTGQGRVEPAPQRAVAEMPECRAVGEKKTSHRHTRAAAVRYLGSGCVAAAPYRGGRHPRTGVLTELMEEEKIKCCLL